MTVLVIGGGVSGLAAARELSRRGVDVVVHEAGERPGGVLFTERREGFRLEHGANGFLPAAGGAAELCDQLGVEVVEAAPAARRRWIYRGERLRALPASPVEIVTSDVVSWRGKLAMAAEPLRRARPELDESVGAFARRRLGGEAAEAIVAPFAIGVFAGDADRLSLRAAFPKLAALEAQGGIVRGGIRQALAARRGGAGRRRRRLCAPRDGAGALTAALAAELGDRVRCGRRVVALERDGRGVVAVDEGGGRETFATAVVALPAPAASELVAAAAPELSRALTEIPVAPVAVAHLGYRREDIAHALDGFGFLVAAGEPLRVLGAVFESVIWPERAPEGSVLIRCLFGGSRDPGALELRDDALVDRAHTDLERALGARARPHFQRVVRWPRAIAQYTLGHLERVARAEALADRAGVVLAGASYRGVAVNDCVAAASRVADAVLRRTGVAAAAMLALVLCACGGKNVAAHGGDVDDGGKRQGVVVTDGDAGVLEGDDSGVGAALVTPTWLWPPASLRQSPGRDACQVQRRPPLSVHVMGGVHDAVVEIQGVPPRLDAPPAATLRGCRLEPRVLVAEAGATVELVSATETPRTVTVERVAGGGAERVASLPLRVAGHRYELDAGEPGVLRLQVDGARGDVSYVFVSAHAAAVTDERGEARFDDLKTGQYTVRAWHPPVSAEAPALSESGTLAVRGGRTARAKLSLDPKP